MLRFSSILIFCIVLIGCTTIDSIQSKPPSYTLTYSGVEQEALSSCIEERFGKKSSYRNVKRLETDYTIIESYVPAYVGLAPAGNVPYFATRIYSDRVDIYGRFSIWGDHGKNVIPTIEECVSSLGGTSSQQTAK